MLLFTRLFAAWMRIGIYARLFLPILCITVVVPTVRMVSLIRTETSDSGLRYSSAAHHLASYVAATVLPPVADSDEASLRRILSSTLLLNPDLLSIRWQRTGQQIEGTLGQPVAVTYPGWFGRLINLNNIVEILPVTLPAGGHGMLALTFSPVLVINRIWQRVKRQAAVTSFNVLLVLAVFLMLSQILRANRNTLNRLAHANERFKQGEHSVRMELGLHLTREGLALADTFNHMAAAVQTLVTSLKTSQEKLAGQLLKTLDVQSALQKMLWENYHDSLTGLPNRAALTERVEQLLFLSKERQRPLALCLFDLDHFTAVNETLGGAAGDDILREVAQRLRHFAAEEHYVARLGGDEFVLLLSEQTDAADIEQNVAQLLRQLSAPYQQAGQALKLSVSAGVALCHHRDMSSNTLLRQADQALYHAKLTGRSKYHVFDAELDEEVRTHHNRRSEIEQALRAGHLQLHYQPKVNLRSGAIVGMEALLRWQHPQRGILGPVTFLPLIEHDDLIIEIGDWVLRQALHQIAAWRAAGRDWVVSVNLAARQFQQADFVARLCAMLAEFPTVPANRLQLEVLESAALIDLEQMRSVMLACQQLGITFALDDFGTGYSTMRYLKRLPVNVLKIDRSFVGDMLEDQDDLYLVSAVIGLAKSFRLEVIAEGVETVEQGVRLMQLGCDLAQGFGIAHPMRPETVLDWADAFRPAAAWHASAVQQA